MYNKAAENVVKTRGLGPHSRRHRLGNLDRRTYEAKLFEEFQADLTAHVGANPNVVQAALIERAAWVRLRLAAMDSKIASGDFGEQDSNVYLAWANTLASLVARLGLQPTAGQPADPLAELHAHIRRGEAA